MVYNNSKYRLKREWINGTYFEKDNKRVSLENTIEQDGVFLMILLYIPYIWSIL